MREPASKKDLVYLVGKHWQYITVKTQLESLTFVDADFDAKGVFDGTDARIAVEVVSGDFFTNEYDGDTCDVLVCWEHDYTVRRDIPGEPIVEVAGGYVHPMSSAPKSADESDLDPFDRADIDVVEVAPIFSEYGEAYDRNTT